VLNNLAQDGVGWENRINLWIFKGVLLCSLLVWAFRRERLRLADLGLQRDGLGLSLSWGLILGLAMGIPPMIFFAFPLITPDPVQYQGYVGLDRAGILATIFVHQLVFTAFGEELLFRGWMQARAIQELGTARGIVFTNVLFILWHVVVTWQSMGRTSLVDALIPLPLLYVATAVPLGVGGAIFSLLRLRTHNLAGCVLAHWTTNCLMLASLAVKG
jgi:membrane protease YdiL (CAAX protease family)